MILKELYITESVRCPFNEAGLSVILAKNHSPSSEKKTSDTNGVGKSKIVQCVRHILGGDNGKTFHSNFFKEKSYWGLLHVKKKNDEYVIARPLWKPFSDTAVVVFAGTLESHFAYLRSKNVQIHLVKNIESVKTVFDGDQRYSIFDKEGFQNFISRELQIDYSAGNIKLSSLLDYIMRDEFDGFSDIISRISRTEWVQNRSMQYLLGLPATIEENNRNLKDEISAVSTEIEGIRKLLSKHNIKTVDTIENKKVSVERDFAQVEHDIASVHVATALEDVREKYVQKREDLKKINAEINIKENYSANYSKNLEDLKNKEIALKDLLDVENFFKEIVDYFPEMAKQNIDRYNAFFNSISEDRKSYYSEIRAEVTRELKVLKKKKEEINRELNILSEKFNATTIVADVATLASKKEELSQILKELADAREQLQQVDNLQEKVEEIENKRKNLIKNGKDSFKKRAESRKQTIKLFQDLVFKVYKSKDGALDFDFNDALSSSIAGRTEIICSIPSQDSKGRMNAKISIFDMVWFLRNRIIDDEEFNPCFLFHDGPYSIISPEPKSLMIKEFDSLCRASGKQYIITANTSDFQDSDEIEKFASITLDGSSENGKFFKEQFENVYTES